MIAVLVVLGVMLGWLRIWQRRCQPDAELVRKLLHIGMGLFALSFPMLFTTVWQALVLCGASIGLLWAIRRVTWLQQRFGAVLSNVRRCSHGEMYFALGVTILFCFARHSMLLYAIPLLILTFADAAAALIGKQFGRHRLVSFGSTKSVEGSLAFFGVTTITTLILLIIVAALSVTHALLIALVLAMGLTLLEACAGRGLDNLLLPIGAYGLLDYLLYRTTTEVLALLLLAFWVVALLTIVWKELQHGSTYSYRNSRAA
jgi:phytol kinase